MSKLQIKKFKDINEDFKCLNCGHLNPPSPKSCRNHCRECLFSLHLDKTNPGDRQSNCHSLMKPIGISKSTKKGYTIIHQCLKCQKQINNKTDEDDNFDTIIKYSNPFNHH